MTEEEGDDEEYDRGGERERGRVMAERKCDNGQGESDGGRRVSRGEGFAEPSPGLSLKRE